MLMLMRLLKECDDFDLDLDYMVTRGCQNSDAPQVPARECGLNSSHSQDINPHLQLHCT